MDIYVIELQIARGMQLKYSPVWKQFNTAVVAFRWYLHCVLVFS